MLPSKIDQMKASHETGSEANFGFGRALMPSYLGKAAFFSFRMQPQCVLPLVSCRLLNAIRCLYYPVLLVP